MSLTYTAKSPTDLANFFEEMARRADSKADHLRPLSTHTLLIKREVSTWKQAAEVTRNTKFENLE